MQYLKKDNKTKEKVCTKCNEEKNLTEFGKKKTGKDGLASACKECRNASMKKHYQENAEKIKAQRKKHYQENAEKEKAYSKKWQKENPEKAKARNKKWRQENAEELKANSRKYRQDNLEKVKAYSKKWKEANPEKARASSRLNSSKRRAQKRNTQVEDITDKLLNEHWVKNNIDPEKCYYCDEGLYEHLEHCTPLSRGGTHTKENLVPSCAHCNLSKGTKTPDEWDKHRGVIRGPHSSHFAKTNKK